MDLQTAYNKLLQDPTQVLSVYDSGMPAQFFQFVEPPSYTTAAQNNKLVMQETRVSDIDSEDSHSVVRNHWGFLFDKAVEQLRAVDSPVCTCWLDSNSSDVAELHISPCPLASH